MDRTTKLARDRILNALQNFSLATHKTDLSVIIRDFLQSELACTHEFDRIAEKGYLTCKCGKNMKWPDND